MNKIVLHLIAFLTFSGFNILFAQEDESISFLVESSAQSKYVWRGLTSNTGLIIQPAVSANYNNFNAQVWGSYTANDIDNDIKRHELDLIFWYDYEVEEITISPSFNYYKYPGQEDSPPTVELGLSFSYSLAEFTFATNFNKDIKEAKGAFAAVVEVSYEPGITENISIGLTSGIGWANKSFNEYYVGIYKNAFSYLSLKGAVNYTIGDIFTVSPFVEYYQIPDTDIKEMLYDNVFNYGMSLSLSF